MKLDEPASDEIALGEGERANRSVHSQDPPRDPIRLVSFRELIQRKDQPWLVEDMIPQAGIVVLYGPPNSGKTFLALHLAACIALNRRFADRRTTEGGVLYVGGEGLGSLKKRVEAAFRSIAELCESTLDDRITFIEDPISFLDPERVGDLIEVVRKMPSKPLLLVLDPLIDCISGGDENSSLDMQRFMDSVKTLRKQLGVTVLIVHHTVKSDKSTERGSSVLRAGADTMISILESGDHRGQAECTKQRDAERFLPIAFQLEVYQLPSTGECPQRTSCTVSIFPDDTNMTPHFQSDWERVREWIGKYAPDEGATVSQISAGTGISASKIYKALDALEDEGYVTKEKKGKTLRIKLRSAAA